MLGHIFKIQNPSHDSHTHTAQTAHGTRGYVVQYLGVTSNNHEHLLNHKSVQIMEDDAGALTSLASAALEAFLHQLIYVGNVYPLDSFTKSTFLGIVGYTNRHSGVVDYISQCIRVAVPVLLTGSGGQMIVLVGKEHFVLTMRINSQTPEQEPPGPTATCALRLLESRFRDLILSVHAMERRREKNETFQIHLRPVHDCEELVRGISEGKWYQINQDPNSSENNNNGMIRPIYDIHSEDCDMSFFSQLSNSNLN